MADTLIYSLGVDGSSAYQSINQISAYAQKKFQNINAGGGKNPFQTLTQGSDVFSRSLSRTNDRVLAFAASTSVIYGLGAAFKSLYQSSITVEKSMANIAVNATSTTKELNQLERGLFSVASSAGQSFYAAADAAAEFARQGLKTNKILEATRAALVLTQTTGMDTVASVKALTSIVNTFEGSGLKYTDIVNKMAAADTNFAVSSQDLAEAISRVGSTAVDANVGFDQLLATITAIQQRTARGGGVIGNSLKTIFTRLQRDDNSQAIQALGVSTKNADGTFRNQIDVLSQLAQKYDKLSDSQRSQVAEMVGGVYQINIVKSIFQDLGNSASVYSQALKAVQTAQNDAFVKSSFLSETNVSLIERAKNSTIELASAIGKLGANNISKGLLKDFSTITNEITNGLSADLGGKSLVDILFDNAKGQSDVNFQDIGAKIGQSLVGGITSTLAGPGLALAAKAIGRISGQTVATLKKELSGNIYGNRLGSPARERLDKINESNVQLLKSISQEAQLQQAFKKTNSELQNRVSLLKNAVAVQAASVSTELQKSVKRDLTPKFTKDFGAGKFPDRTNKQLSNVLGLSGNSIQEKGALTELKKRQKSLIQDFYGEDFSKSNGAGRILNQIGAFKNAKSGLKFADLDSSALRQIVGGSGIQNKGAANELFKREEQSRIRNKEQGAAALARLEQIRAKQKVQKDFQRTLNQDSFLSLSAGAKSSSFPFFNKNKKNLNDLASRFGVAEGSDVYKQGQNIFGSIQKERNQQRRAAFSARVDKFALGGALIGGVAGQAIGGKAGERISSFSSNIATGAVLGSSFGPFGTAIGAVVGGLKSLADSSKESSIGLGNFNQAVEASRAESEKQRNAISTFATVTSRLNELVNNPDANPIEIRNAARERGQALVGLTPQDRQLLLNETDSQKINSIQDRIVRDTGAKANADTALGSIGANAEKNNSSIGLLFRNLTGDASRTKLDAGDAQAALNSFVQNLDLTKVNELSSKGFRNQKRQADDLLKALNEGDFKTVASLSKDLGLASKDAVDAFKNLAFGIKGPEVALLRQATKNAYEDAKDLDASTELFNRRLKESASAIADFKRLAETTGLRDSSNSVLRDSLSSIQSERLGRISDSPTASGAVKSLIDNARKLIGADSQRNTRADEFRKSANESLNKLISDKGVGGVESQLGQGFVNNLQKSFSGNFEDIQAGLNALEAGAGKFEGVSELISGIKETKTAMLQANVTLSKDEAILREAANTLRSIEKKTKFDSLIDALLSQNPSEQGNSDFNFGKDKNGFFNTTPKEKKDIQSALDQANRGNTNPLITLQEARAADAKKLLEAEREKFSKTGTRSLTPQQAAKLNLAAIQGDNISYVNSLAENGISSSTGTRSGKFTRDAFDRVRDNVSRGGGTITSLQEAQKALESAAAQLDPKSNNAINLNSSAKGIQSRISSLLKDSGAFSDVESLLPDRIKKLTAEKNTSGASALSDAQQRLTNGDFSGVRKALIASGQTDILDKFDKSNTISNFQKSFGESINSKGLTDAGELDSNINKDLNTSVNNLSSATSALTTAVDNFNKSIGFEQKISQLGQESQGISNQIAAKDRELNILLQGRKDDTRITAEEAQNFESNLPSAKQTLSDIQNTKTTSEFAKEAADYFRNNLDKSQRPDGVSAKQESDYADALKEEISRRRKAGQNTIQDEYNLNSTIRIRNKNLENGTSNSANENIDRLTKEIQSLIELQKAKDQETNKVREESKSNQSTTSETNTNVSLNINGADSTFVDAIRPAAESWIRDAILRFQKDPKYYTANGGLGTA